MVVRGTSCCYMAMPPILKMLRVLRATYDRN